MNGQVSYGFRDNTIYGLFTVQERLVLIHCIAN